MKIKISILIYVVVALSCSASKNRGLIIGTWATSPIENIEFIIYKKGIQYFDNEYMYDYKIQYHRLIILDSSKVVLKFKICILTKDSLILQSENNGNSGMLYRYYRVDTGN